MTKKSYARQQRDLEARKNGTVRKKAVKSQAQKDMELQQYLKRSKGWDELNNVYEKNAVMAITSLSVPQALFDTPGVKENLDLTYADELELQMKNLSKDVNAYVEALIEIHKSHADKTGAFADINEMMNGISIFERYQETMNGYTCIIKPQYDALVQAGTDAIERMNKKKELQAQEQNPNVVTDIEFKDVQ